MEDRIIEKIKLCATITLIAIFLFGFINTGYVVGELQDLNKRLDRIGHIK